MIQSQNNRQREFMEFKYNLAYEASAGSGKTFMLVVRYLSLLFMGADASKIMALTFTNKAANEMHERIIVTLEELQERAELDEIVKITHISKDKILKKRKKVLEMFLNSNSKIMTIDKFFVQILRKFSLYVSLMPDFKVAASQHETKLLNYFLDEIGSCGSRDTLITLSLESKKRFGDIFKLLDEFYIRHYEMEDFNFTKAEYIKFEQEAMLALKGIQDIVYGCEKASESLKKAVRVESFDELRYKSWVFKESLQYWVFKKCYIPQMDIYLKKIQSSLLSHMRAKEKNFFYALSELVSVYKKSKKALYKDDGELSFSDVTVLVYEILKKHIDREFLYFRLDAHIQHILLDEFQDTSIIQYEIIKPLIDEILSGAGSFENGSFFFVGDVKQSIYRFRGGVSALFDAVSLENSTEVQKLVTNYRSFGNVVEFVNNTFEHKIKNYTPQKVQNGAEGGYVEIVNNNDVVEGVYDFVKKLLDMGASKDDIAILCATNQDGESIKEMLVSNGMEVVTETTTKLINQTGVKAVLEYLKYLYFKEQIYKENFFMLISKKPKEIKNVDFTKVSLMEVIKSIIDEYGLFDDGFHIIKFLNEIRVYKDIEELLFEYERMDALAAASEFSGIKVLTIHKSKGLEYEHVIVMDALRKKPPSRDTIIYEYDGIKLKNIYLRTKGREELDTNYKKALDKEKELIREDNLNALYVAFTRARRNLLIVKKEKDSIFGDLNLDSYTKGEMQFVNKIPQENPPCEHMEFEELYYGMQGDILKLEKDTKEEIESVNFGLAMHYMLEMLGDFSLHSMQNAYNMMLNRYGYLLNEEALRDIYDRVERLLKNDSFMLKVGNSICYKEKAIRYKNNLRYIDLLIKKEDGWVVIDYKSSKKYEDEHKKQLAFYKRGVEAITSENVSGYICYLLKDSIELIKA